LERENTGALATMGALLTRPRGFLAFSLAGFLAILALQLQCMLLWGVFYSRFPWEGYSNAMQMGAIPASLTTSQASCALMIVALVLLPLLSFRSPNQRLFPVWSGLWLGVMTGLIAIWISTPQLRNDSNLWPIDLVMLAIATAIPVLVGTVIVFLVRLFRVICWPPGCQDGNPG